MKNSIAFNIIIVLILFLFPEKLFSYDMNYNQNSFLFHNISADLEVFFGFAVYKDGKSEYRDGLISMFWYDEDDDDDQMYGLGIGLQYTPFLTIPNWLIWRETPFLALGPTIYFSLFGGNGDDDDNFITRVSIGITLKICWILNISYGYGYADFINTVKIQNEKTELSRAYQYVGAEISYPFVPGIHAVLSYNYSRSDKRNAVYWDAHNARIGAALSLDMGKLQKML